MDITKALQYIAIGTLESILIVRYNGCLETIRWSQSAGRRKAFFLSLLVSDTKKRKGDIAAQNDRMRTKG